MSTKQHQTAHEVLSHSSGVMDILSKKISNDQELIQSDPTSSRLDQYCMDDKKHILTQLVNKKILCK